MTTKFLKVTLICAMLSLIISCSKESTNNVVGNSDLPYFEYSINGAAAVRVECDKIIFEGQSSKPYSGVLAGFTSTLAQFTFDFPSTATAINKLSPGIYAVREYSSFYSTDSIPFRLTVKVPKTAGVRNYYYSKNPASASEKNEVTKIEKGEIEKGKRVYNVQGSYKVQAKDTANVAVQVTGSYKFKLLLIE